MKKVMVRKREGEDKKGMSISKIWKHIQEKREEKGREKPRNGKREEDSKVYSKMKKRVLEKRIIRKKST